MASEYLNDKWLIEEHQSYVSYVMQSIIDSIRQCELIEDDEKRLRLKSQIIKQFTDITWLTGKAPIIITTPISKFNMDKDQLYNTF